MITKKWEELPMRVKKKFIKQGVKLLVLMGASYYQAEDGEWRMVK